MLTISVSPPDHCRRVDSLIRNILPDAPISYLRKLVSSGHLLVNARLCGGGDILTMGDQVTLKESTRLKVFLTGGRTGLDILYEDSWIIVFDKPGGMPMHRAAEVDHRNLVEAGTTLLRQRGEEGKLRPVNRLDRGTSGVVLLAKSSTAAGMFGRLVREEGLDKLYLAVVTGEMSGEGSIDEPLDGRDAATRYQSLCKGNGMALVALTPLTGRTHQLRKHLSLIGHPVMGDIRYGGYPLPANFPGFALHSFRTAFTHPATGIRETVCAPLSAPFFGLAGTCGREAFTCLFPSLPKLACSSSLFVEGASAGPDWTCRL